MRCPSCDNPDSKVLESRDLDQVNAIRRRRECLACGHRFTTYERIETNYLMVIKKSGDRELFNRDKLASGIYKAFEKRPVPAAKIEELINNIERELRASDQSEVSSRQVGELVMKKLLLVDDVAYVRFASVYRSFRSVKNFETELARVKKHKQIKPS